MAEGAAPDSSLPLLTAGTSEGVALAVESAGGRILFSTGTLGSDDISTVGVGSAALADSSALVLLVVAGTPVVALAAVVGAATAAVVETDLAAG